MEIIFGPEFFLGQITCPVLSALVNETDLVPNEFGFVSRQQVFNAFRRIGISLEAATETTVDNFAHLPDPQMINIFDMNLPRPTRPAPTGNLEQDKSTGIRDAFVPDALIFRIFEQFIGADGLWRLEDIRKAIAFFTFNPNDVGTGPATLRTLELMFVEFALGEENVLTQFEMRQLFLNHTYPAAFRARRDLLVSLVDKGVVSGGEKLQQPWTFLGCHEDAPPSPSRRVPGPDQVNECATLCRVLGFTFFSLRSLDDCFCSIPNIFENPVPNSECDLPCLVFNGCGGSLRTSAYRLGSAASEGLAREFPSLPELFPRVGPTSFNTTSFNSTNLSNGAPVGHTVFSACVAVAGAVIGFSLLSL